MQVMKALIATSFALAIISAEHLNSFVSPVDEPKKTTGKINMIVILYIMNALFKKRFGKLKPLF